MIKYSLLLSVLLLNSCFNSQQSRDCGSILKNGWGFISKDSILSVSYDNHYLGKFNNARIFCDSTKNSMAYRFFFFFFFLYYFEVVILKKEPNTDPINIIKDYLSKEYGIIHMELIWDEPYGKIENSKSFSLGGKGISHYYYKNRDTSHIISTSNYFRKQGKDIFVSWIQLDGSASYDSTGAKTQIEFIKAFRDSIQFNFK